MGADDRHGFVVELAGSRARNGIGLFDLESFIDAFLRGLRAFDRSRRLEPGLRAGHPTKRDELVTAFQLVRLEPGSAVLHLEAAPPPIDAADAAMFPDPASLATGNLAALLSEVEGKGQFDSDVAEALGAARRALGRDGQITVRRGQSRVVIDERTEERLSRRTRSQGASKVSISGRLHAIDLEPDRVGIRATDGVDWSCRYPEELEEEVAHMLGENVWARGVGQKTGAGRGTLDLEELQAVGPFEQTELFTWERVPLDALLAEQGIRGPTAPEALALPGDVTDEQLDTYLAELLRES